jgi:hypothetical protein
VQEGPFSCPFAPLFRPLLGPEHGNWRFANIYTFCIYIREAHRDEIVLREKAGGMVRVLDLLAELPADMFPKKRKDPQPQRRKGL